MVEMKNHFEQTKGNLQKTSSGKFPNKKNIKKS